MLSDEARVVMGRCGALPTARRCSYPAELAAIRSWPKATPSVPSLTAALTTTAEVKACPRRGFSRMGPRSKTACSRTHRTRGAFAAERRRERAAQDRAERERTNAAAAAADQCISELEDDLAELARATSTTADAFEHELAFVTKENSESKLALAKLETKFAELQIRIIEANTGKAIVDLPPLLPRTAVQ